MYDGFLSCHPSYLYVGGISQGVPLNVYLRWKPQKKQCENILNQQDLPFIHPVFLQQHLATLQH